jgi:hypothetical protein
MRCTCGTASREARNAAHRFSAEHIRARKAYDLKATVAELRELTKLAQRIAELEDHLSQANDTIARMARCQTAADLQREREAEREQARGAWAWPGKDGGVDA